MICTSCQKLLPGNPELWRELQEPMVRNSLSRRDNQTYICNICGSAEATADYLNRDGYASITDTQARRRMEPTL